MIMKKNYLFSNKISQLLFRGCLLALFFIPITLSWGQSGTYTAQNLPYSQNFSTLTGGASPVYPVGWGGGKVSANVPSTAGRLTNATDSGLIASGTGASNSHGIYDFTGKIGFLSSSSGDNSVYLSIVTTGATNVGISFDAMTIRNPYDGTTNTNVQGLVLQYRVGTLATDPFTAIPYSMTEYQNNTTAQTTGTTGQNIKVSLNATLPASCNNQSVVQIRWIFRNVTTGAGSRCSMAIDNVFVGVSASSITPLTYSPGDAVSVPFTANGNYTGGFKAQLSDATGSFATPTDIGTTASNVSGTINATIPSGAVAGSSYRIRTVSITPSIHGSDNGANITVAPLLNYYYKGSGALSDITNWGTNTNGTGTNPLDFISAGQLFNIRNTSAVTTTAAWTVAGAGSKIIVGDASVAPVTLTIASGFPITTTSPVVLDIAAASTGSNSVVLQDAVTPTFGTMEATSEVHYQANLSTGTTKTFGKLYVDGAGTTTTFTGTPVIQTSLTVTSGATLATGDISSKFFTINSGASVTINGTFQTQKAAGFTSANQATTSNGGAIQFINSENLTLGSDSVIEYNRVTSGSTTFQVVTPRTDYKNLTISTTGSIPTVTLAGATKVSGVLTVNANAILDSAGFLTLKSDAAGTARVAQVFGNITGKVTVERYIPGKRAWRALTAPVIGTSTNSIFANWQNGGTPSAGTGVELWSTTGGNNMGTGPNNSILKYNSSGTTGAWNAVTNTLDDLFGNTINNAFMVFVTGPYYTTNTNVANGFADTTLRAKGALIVGTKTYTTLPSGVHTLIGNPYACPISPLSLLNGNTNFGNYLWIWDAKATGNFGLGAYNTYDKMANQYTNITNNTPLATTPDIQSGQAFFVKATSGTATFTILESYKTSVAANTTVLRTGTPPELVRVGLYKQENNEWNGRDGAMTVLLADADANQAPNKMNNGSENIVFTKNGASFASNHHLPLVASDVLNVKVWNATVGANYKLKINTEDFVTTNLDATLEDLFTNARTPLALDGTAVEYPFSVTADALSTGDRFRIVFQSSTLGTNNPKANGFSIVPNPVTGDAFQLNLGALPIGTYTYSICNTLGQEVEKGSINNAAQNTNHEVKMSNSATGIYLMKIKGSDNSVFTAKIIKK
jgi:hypothetical protein